VVEEVTVTVRCEPCIVVFTRVAGQRWSDPCETSIRCLSVQLRGERPAVAVPVLRSLVGLRGLLVRKL
jgi:hypothetical protein